MNDNHKKHIYTTRISDEYRQYVKRGGCEYRHPIYKGPCSIIAKYETKSATESTKSTIDDNLYNKNGFKVGVIATYGL